MPHLPIPAVLRKRLKKTAGETVALELYDDRYAQDFATAVRESLAAEGASLLARFEGLSPKHQDALLNWAYRPSNAEEQVRRVLAMSARVREAASGQAR